VTSGIFRSAGAQSFGGAHRGRICVRVFIWMSVRACCEHLRCTVFKKKMYIPFDIFVEDPHKQGQ